MMSQTAIFRQLTRKCMRHDPFQVSNRTACGELLQAMADRDERAAIVVDAENRLAGIVTERDIARRIVFRTDAAAAVETVMTTPVITIRDDDLLYLAIGRMRRYGLRHMPVVDRNHNAVGMISMHDAFNVAAEQMVDHIDRLTHEESLDGMADIKSAQVAVAQQLLDDRLPGPEIQALLTDINNDIHQRVTRHTLRQIEQDGMGKPPVAFDMIVMGSGGRGESYLYPDQDNGFVLEDYPDAEHTAIDGWFSDFAERLTRNLDHVGFPLCHGHVMATNPIWRKTVSQWLEQTSYWVRSQHDVSTRLFDIFFDFKCVYGTGALAERLRQHVTTVGRNPAFLRAMYRLDEEHKVALGWFGRLIPDRESKTHRGQINLKITGTLPLVEAVRILALRHGVAKTDTLGRIERLGAAGVLDHNEQDYLAGAFRHISFLLLRQQLSDFAAGRQVGNHVPPQRLTRRERDMLVDGFKAISTLRDRLKSDFTGDIF